jgi:Tol biopolymer transport system component/tRNA A-37 threonylcarbamoyl transferase component Bud32
MLMSPGARLGSYEIVAPIGAGGMGEVYKAKDTKLDRDVAIKVLPEEFFEDKERKARFEREAKALAALNHSNIAAIYSFEEIAGRHFLVMELLEGETLADRLATGRLALGQVVSVGNQICAALEAAHRKGIVHRDLKPGNVMLTKSGVKLLDFGLAKALASAGPAEDLSSLPTAGGDVTRDGAILGTLSYMAPEQLQGRPADVRSDLFAFGAVLYEMATGKKAFPGPNQASVITAILTSEPPDVSSLSPPSPKGLDRLVRGCLAKDPEDRWQSARDVALQLRGIAESPESAAGDATPPHPGLVERLAWAVAVLAAAGVAWWAGGRGGTGSGLVHPVRFQVPAPENASFNVIGRDAGPVAVSPDGQRLAFVATTSEGRKLLYVRSLESLTSQPLAGTDGASFPFWSPDSRFLGFFAEGKLKKIPAAGGPSQVLAEAPLGRGGTWNREDVVIYAPNVYDPLFRVSAAGGDARQLTKFVDPTKDFSHRWPCFLPDGRHFVFLKWGATPRPTRTQDAVYVGSLDSDETTFLFQASSPVAYAPPGYLLYLRDDTLMAVPFDARSRRVTGTAVPLVARVLCYSNTGSGAFSVSQYGVLTYQAGAAPVVSQLNWYDREGRPVGMVGAPGDYEDPRISPDGSAVAVNRIDPVSGTTNIWLLGIGRDSAERFTFSASFDHYPVWSPDGRRIAFDTNRNGSADLYSKAVGGSSGEEQVIHSGEAKSPTDWSPDGRFLIYERFDPKTKWDLWALPAGGGQPPAVLLHSEGNEVDGRVSPDGRWIAYASDESGRWQVYVASFPSPGGRWQISSDGGTQPVWRRDGRELFYLGADRKLMAVPITAGPRFGFGPPHALFQTRARYTGNIAYDVAPDGQRFLVNTLVGSEAIPPITVVMNWTAALSR